MLLLTSTTDKIELVTSAATAVDVNASFMDHTLSNDNVEGGRKNTAITTAATTDIVDAPAAGVTRNVKELHIRNKGATPNTVTVRYNQNGTLFELDQAELGPDQKLRYIEGVGFDHKAPTLETIQIATADQTANAADTYLTSANWNLSTYTVKIGTQIRWRLVATKTAAGTATPIFNVRFGTAGTTADTARLTFTGNAQTAAIDTGSFVIHMIFRAIGGTAVVHGKYELHHQLATTGFSTLNHNVIQVLSSAFDMTPANTIVGLSVNPGASGVWTFQQVLSEVHNL